MIHVLASIPAGMLAQFKADRVALQTTISNLMRKPGVYPGPSVELSGVERPVANPDMAIHVVLTNVPSDGFEKGFLMGGITGAFNQAFPSFEVSVADKGADPADPVEHDPGVHHGHQHPPGMLPRG